MINTNHVWYVDRDEKPSGMSYCGYCLKRVMTKRKEYCPVLHKAVEFGMDCAPPNSPSMIPLLRYVVDLAERISELESILSAPNPAAGHR